MARRGPSGERWVAETPVVRNRPAKPRPGGRTGKVREVRGEPLPLRLVMAEIHLADGTSECWL